MKKHCILFVACMAACSAIAQNWTGAVSSDWNNPANWSSAPVNGDDIEIDPANYTGAMAQPLVTGSSSFTPAEMLVQNGALLTINGTLNASDRVEVLGAGTIVLISSGTFALTGGGNNARLIFAEDSHLQMEGGSLTVGQRLLFELGASGEINAGTVTVQETIALIDGSAAASSLLVQTGGTIITNGEFAFENEAGFYVPAFEQTGGTLNINGNLIVLGAAPGAGRGYVRSSGGTVTVTGTITNDPTSTMNMQLELSGTAVLNNNGTAVTLLAGDSVIIGNGAAWNDNAAVVWQNNGAVYGESEGIFTSGNTVLTGTGSYQFGNLAVPAAKQLTHASPALMAVSGDLSVQGGFSHNSNRLLLNGASLQAVSAASALSLYDLSVDNSAAGSAIQLNSTLTISHNFDLTDGILVAIPAAAIRLPDNATITGGSDTAFVDGYIEKTGDDAILFPLGKSPDRYRPLSVSAPSATTTLIRAAYFNTAFTDLTPAEMPVQAVSALEYWDLSRSGSADLFTASVGWNDASQSGLTDCNDITLTVWNGTQWSFVPSTAAGLCNGDNAGTLTSSGQLPVAGPLTIGFTENVYQHAVEICPGTFVTVDTNTYSEPGIYTDVLQDINGEDSTIITILSVIAPLTVTVTATVISLEAASAEATHYQWIDCANGNTAIAGETGTQFFPVNNGSYAVVVTRDNCADADTSACFMITELGVEEEALSLLRIYPNPVAGNGQLSVNAQASISAASIWSADGRLVYRCELNSQAGEVISLQLPEFKNGTYFLHTETVAGVRIARFIVTAPF